MSTACRATFGDARDTIVLVSTTGFNTTLSVVAGAILFVQTTHIHWLPPTGSWGMGSDLVCTGHTALLPMRLTAAVEGRTQSPDLQSWSLWHAFFFLQGLGFEPALKDLV